MIFFTPIQISLKSRVHGISHKYLFVLRGLAKG